MEKKYIKLILILILFDAISTIFWHTSMGIGEANPVMSYFIERSAIDFVVAKLGVSFISLGVLSYFSDNKLSKIGVLLVMIIYILISIMHIVALFII